MDEQFYRFLDTYLCEINACTVISNSRRKMLLEVYPNSPYVPKFIYFMIFQKYILYRS